MKFNTNQIVTVTLQGRIEATGTTNGHDVYTISYLLQDGESRMTLVPENAIAISDRDLRLGDIFVKDGLYSIITAVTEDRFSPVIINLICFGTLSISNREIYSNELNNDYTYKGNIRDIG